MSRTTPRRRGGIAPGPAGILATGTAVTLAVAGAVPAQGATTSPTTAGGATSTVSATRTIKCYDKPGGKPFYDPPSASKTYDKWFRRSAALPKLGSYIPQGVGTWWNWSGSKNLLLVAMYHPGRRSLIVGIDPATNKVVGDVAIAPTHAGGITTAFGWAFVQGSKHGIRKYKLSKLAAAMKKPGTPYVKSTGSERKVYWASFLTSYGDSLFAGRFNAKGRGKMYQYKIKSNGTLTTIKKAWEIPTKTQGLLVTKSHFIYSTSAGHKNLSNLYVVRRGQRDLDKAKLTCFRAPSMSEGITDFGGYAYLAFESGSYKYRHMDGTKNVISNLHRAKISSLISLL